MSTIRQVELGYAPCTVCDQDVRLRLSDGTRTRRVPVGVHGPRGDRCPGSRKPGKTFLEYTGLPTWDRMSDLDKGCALMFLWKCHWERSYAYARDNYPCTYRGDQILAGLTRLEACRHAMAVTGGYRAIDRMLGNDEFKRLYDLALTADRAVS